MARVKSKIVRKAASSTLDEPEAQSVEDEVAEEEPKAAPAGNPVIVILRGADCYSVAGMRFTKNVPVAIDPHRADIFRAKGWFEVIG